MVYSEVVTHAFRLDESCVRMHTGITRTTEFNSVVLTGRAPLCPAVLPDGTPVMVYAMFRQTVLMYGECFPDGSVSLGLLPFAGAGVASRLQQAGPVQRDGVGMSARFSYIECADVAEDGMLMVLDNGVLREVSFHNRAVRTVGYVWGIAPAMASAAAAALRLFSDRLGGCALVALPGQQVAVVDETGAVILFDTAAATGIVLAQYDAPVCAAAHPDGKRLFVVVSREAHTVPRGSRGNPSGGASAQSWHCRRWSEIVAIDLDTHARRVCATHFDGEVVLARFDEAGRLVVALTVDEGPRRLLTVMVEEAGAPKAEATYASKLSFYGPTPTATRTLDHIGRLWSGGYAPRTCDHIVTCGPQSLDVLCALPATGAGPSFQLSAPAWWCPRTHRRCTRSGRAAVKTLLLALQRFSNDEHARSSKAILPAIPTELQEHAMSFLALWHLGAGH